MPLQPIDRLVVDIALDNMSDNYSSKPAHVAPEFNNVIAAGATELSGHTLCCAQLGLALVLTAYVGEQPYKLLFDAGPEGELFLRNCQNLGVSLADVAAIAISHGHWDHMDALIAALDHITDHNRSRQVPCHVNAGMFLERGAQLTNGQIAPFQPVPSVATLTALPSKVPHTPVQIDDRFICVGPAGGGYGSPLARDPQQVLDDVRDGLIRIDTARRDFAVA